jgi:RNA polymerase sigma-70 factor (ECF subfamily)
VIERRSPSREPFDAFYRREYGSTVAIARGLLGSGAPAEDLAQECFVAAHRHWERISGYEDPRGWLRRVLVNKATSFHRRRIAEWRAMARVGLADETLPEISPRSTEVWDEVRRLPRRQAQATVLHYVDQMTVGEIAAVLGCSPGTVKSHLFRARERLGKRLAGLEEASR